MKRVLIVGPKEVGLKNDPAVIAEHLASTEVECTTVFWEDLVFDVKTSNVSVRFAGREVADFAPDLVITLGWYKSGKRAILRELALSFSAYLEHNKIIFWNSEVRQQRSTGKLSCMTILALAGIEVTDTKFSLTKSLVNSDLTYPVVIKASQASRGASNYLVNNDDEAEHAFGDLRHNTMVVQPVFANDHDLRVICFDGKPALVLKRSRAPGSTSHLNNTSQGGEAAWLDLDSVNSQLLTISEKICTVMHREMAGIDFIPDANSPYGYACLEVNAVPQLTSGHDVQNKLAALANAIQGIQ